MIGILIILIVFKLGYWYLLWRAANMKNKDDPDAKDFQTTQEIINDIKKM